MISGYANTKPGETDNDGFNMANIQRKIKEYESNFTPPNGDMKLFDKQVSGYQDLGVLSIPVTESLINKYINTFSESDKDSVFALFNQVFYSQVNIFNDSLESKYSTILHKIDKNKVDAEVTEFKKCLDLCGMSLLNSEGDYYVDAKYDYYYDLFKDRVSPALNEYLKIRKKELKEGFTEDAELLISFNELYERVVTWENFNTRYPDFFIKDDTRFYYSSYLSTLITGLDNSQLFDTETEKLLPELNKLYLKIIFRNETLKSTKVIKDYYELLRSNNFKMPEKIDSFLKENDLFLMLGVQPETR